MHTKHLPFLSPRDHYHIFPRMPMPGIPSCSKACATRGDASCRGRDPQLHCGWKVLQDHIQTYWSNNITTSFLLTYINMFEPFWITTYSSIFDYWFTIHPSRPWLVDGYVCCIFPWHVDAESAMNSARHERLHVPKVHPATWKHWDSAWYINIPKKKHVENPWFP